MLDRPLFEVLEQPSTHSTTTRAVVHPHPLDVADATRVVLERAAAHRAPAEVGHHEHAARRTHLVGLGRRPGGRVEGRPRPGIELGEVRRQAASARPGARGSTSRISTVAAASSRCTVRMASTSSCCCSSVSGSSRPCANSSERRSSRARSASPFFVSRASRLRRSAGLGTTVTRPASVRLPHQPGEVAGVEGEPGTQGAQLAARGPDLPEQAGLVGVQPAAEEVVGQDTDVLGDGAVEAAYVAQE